CSDKEVKDLLSMLKTNNKFSFDTLIDICVVDYLHYGIDDWKTDSATQTGFSRSVASEKHVHPEQDYRFAVVYHLLSVKNNYRLRVKVYLGEHNLVIPSVVSLWKSANWFEREAYDLFGVLFDGHPDLRRILTDYGFVGHPFRKDFPVSGHVEMRYDAAQQRVIYETVDIEPRVSVPKVIRHDNRYKKVTEEEVLL
ncbi:MAG: NADH-quinone oxidoreductase subunit C, partial [Alphaproteobacteria bacterium]|nr:NADH-quinone oxidoreductase subunit C [Alphaproteobacteria bacterium]